ncbi:helix-turn-helix domain-containing protein [Owenweeksia hongkongensis]
MELTFEIENSEKNTSKGKIENTRVGDGFFMVRVENHEDEPLRIKRDIDKSLIQFYFAVQGGAEFLFNNGNYRLKLEQEKSLLFYNPLVALPLDIEVRPGSKLVFLYITVENLHRMFVTGSEEIEFINKENIGKKFYADRPLSPVLMVTVNQLFSNNVNGPAKGVFEKAKAYEILALFLNKEEGKDVEQCPFLNDEENVERVRNAKKILIEKMTTPPSLKELSREVGLNEYRLKEGFKNIYGKTVFQFLNDYRLDIARQMLDKGNMKVNDAAYHIGYTNPSHFIAAFKKKFGVTPKKYLISNI